MLVEGDLALRSKSEPSQQGSVKDSHKDLKEPTSSNKGNNINQNRRKHIDDSDEVHEVSDISTLGPALNPSLLNIDDPNSDQDNPRGLELIKEDQIQESK